ncbi:hypothetical protein F4781DRAFT_431285 [Annulohypoxylon bovei var. microspora]|nr:hypothetical protein F4781DRAFT_431285 [Annulohypoxylon bovei var. microspora]
MSPEGNVRKTFFLGATGYVGGEALKVILDQYPGQEPNFSVLVRDPKKGESIKAVYPYIRVVYGSLDDTKLLVDESARADIVMNLANADHISAANAIVDGLKQRSAEGKTSFFVHCSGAGILMYDDMQSGKYGEPSSKVYNDWEGLSEMTSFPDDALHRDVEKFVLGASEDVRIKTAVVCPPLIYGIGRGLGNKRSLQIPQLIESFLKRGKGFQVAEGKAYCNNVHVRDLCGLFALFFKEALSGEKNEVWGTDGYYFAESGEHVWGDISTQIAQIAHSKGLIKDASIEKLSNEEVAKISPWGGAIWGQNSRSSAIRAKKLLGWVPKQRSLEEHLPEAIDFEAKRMHLV